MRKCRVGIVFGSRSVEHDVSIITAHQIINALDKDKYEIIPIYITKEGEWITGEILKELRAFGNISLNKSKVNKIFLTPVPQKEVIIQRGKSRLFGRKKSVRLDVVIPAVHGTHGEDGTLQGLLELANIPYVGAGVVGSAVGMDKIIMKAIFRENNLPTVDYLWFRRGDWENAPQKIIEEIESKLDYPVFVKPANLGSSIGIGKAKDRETLVSALDVASCYDCRFLVEKSLGNIMEVNCSVLGNYELVASVCEQPIPYEEFLSFNDKYSHSDKTLGMKGTKRRIPAPLSPELTEKIQSLAKKSFMITDCKGVARVDFLIDKENEQIYINEINTIPGSLSFYLWEESGIKFSELLDKLIQLAFEVHREKNALLYTYDSSNLLIHIDPKTIKTG